jgi:predicted negative regulator of RcsB-dependent stress response
MGTTATPNSSNNSFTEVFERHKRNLGYVGIGLLVAIGGGWYVVRSNTIKEERATKAYQEALQVAMQGNAALAQADLKKMSVRYKGTTAGTQGAMELAKLLYDDGKFEEGIEALKAAKPTDDTKYDVQMLMAAGYEGMGKHDEAAKAYEDALKLARFDSDRDLAKASAARAYTNAGNLEAAVKLWTEIANNPDSPIQAEAKLRLGELTAKIMKA